VGAFAVRAYRDSDAASVRALIVELQDSLREIDPNLPPGEVMASAYLTHTFDQCRAHEGSIFVAEAEGVVVGYGTVLARVPFEGLDSPSGDFAYLMDLVVHAPWRQRGVGGALLEATENAARAAGATELRTLVLHRNRAANLYRRAGMTDYSVTLVKRLDDYQDPNGA
jgi:GNAT superfamily N-acetyltransferase